MCYAAIEREDPDVAIQSFLTFVPPPSSRNFLRLRKFLGAQPWPRHALLETLALARVTELESDSDRNLGYD